MYKIFVILILFIYGCGYPNVNDVQIDNELSITYQETKDIKKLKDEFNK